MGSKIFEGSGRAVVCPVAGLHSWLCAADKPQKALFPSLVWDVVSRGKEGAVAALDGVGRLPRIRVSRSALSVVGGLLALGGLCIVVYCAASFFGIAQQIKIFLASWIVFVKKCRKDEEHEMMAKRRGV